MLPRVLEPETLDHLAPDDPSAQRARRDLRRVNAFMGARGILERALAEHERVQYRRFDLARTLLAQGETLRRFKRKRAARESIEAAIAIFDELGAALWSAKARRELARISGRRTAEGLTETERRVAELVAAGHSNKQVANELHVTVRTVESNLTKVYAKLGVHSRTELARRLSA